MIEGYYYDPKHGNCLRLVKRSSSGTYEISGVYGNDEPPFTHGPWTATMMIISAPVRGPTTLQVHFGGKRKTHNKTMTVEYRNRKLLWKEDGNVWHKLYHHRSQFPTSSV